MGGGTSKFESTNWDKADGCLRERSNTITGNAPTSTFTKVNLIKRGYNQREFDVVSNSNSGNLLYVSRHVLGTLADFDILSSEDGSGELQPVLRIQANLSQRTWIVYRCNRPCFDGQHPSSQFLYKAACVAISWSRKGAVVAQYGPPSLDYMSKLDAECTINHEVDSIEHGISMETTHQQFPVSRVESMDSNDDLFAAAKKVALRRQQLSISPPPSSTESSSSIPWTYSGANRRERRKSAPSCSNSISTPDTSALSPDSSIHGAPFLEKEVSSPILELTSHLIGYKNANIEESSNLTVHENQWKNREERLEEIYQEAMQGVLNLDGKGAILEIQEINNKIVGNHQSSLLSKCQLKRLIKWDDVELRNNFDTPEFTEAGVERQDEDCQENPFVQALKAESVKDMEIQTPSIVEMADDLTLGIESETSSQGTSANGRSSEFENSLASAVAKQTQKGTLSSSSHAMNLLWKSLRISPLPLHSKSKQALDVEAMFASLPNPHPIADPDGTLKTSTTQKALLNGESEATKIDVAANVNKGVDHNEKSKNYPNKNASRTHGDNIDAQQANQVEFDDSDDASDSNSQSNMVAEPLVGYWSWKNTLTVHKMELHLAQGSDLALHVALAIICNQVRSQRNAMAMSL